MSESRLSKKSSQPVTCSAVTTAKTAMLLRMNVRFGFMRAIAPATPRTWFSARRAPNQASQDMQVAAS
jgi:hypothetical protein